MSDTNVLKKEEKEEVLKALNSNEKIEREASISWDGSNFLVRIPKDIVDYLKIEKKNNILFIVDETKEGIKKTFEITKK